MLKGRLGLETARIPQSDRHGLMWLGRGRISVENGTLTLVTAGYDDLPAGTYSIPYQMLTCIVLQPGTTITHDVLRLLARHGTGLAATGEAGVRFYASMPFGPDRSALARRQARLWADQDGWRIAVARRMYAWRLGEILPHADLNVLRGIEGSRMKETYRRLAEQFEVPWGGRRYDRSNPEGDDDVNQAINHASTAVRAQAMLSVAVTGAIPQLGFIHEDSGISFPLDIADLFRDEVTLPVAFGALKAKRPGEKLERAVRRIGGAEFRRKTVVPRMIDRIKELFDANDDRGDA